MIDGTPSRTAFHVAVHRAVHQEIDTPRVFDDPLARAIVGDKDATHRSASSGQQPARVSKFIRAFVVARSRLAEDELAAAVAAGVRQYVVLGAGLDTFAYRNPYRAVGLRVFEVDLPSTQAWKRRRLDAGHIAVPDDVTFVPIDFGRERLTDALTRAGFTTAAPTVFSWLGVTPYLEETVVLETLREIRALSGEAAVTVVFDYAVSRASLSWPSRIMLGLMSLQVKRLGEPWRTTFAATDLDAALRERGFGHVEDLDPAAINARYFAHRRDGLKVGTLARLVVARHE